MTITLGASVTLWKMDFLSKVFRQIVQKITRADTSTIMDILSEDFRQVVQNTKMDILWKGFRQNVQNIIARVALRKRTLGGKSSDNLSEK